MEKSGNQGGMSLVFFIYGNLLALFFIVLKWTGHIEWPWLWVLLPLFIHWAAAFLWFAAYEKWNDAKAKQPFPKISLSLLDFAISLFVFLKYVEYLDWPWVFMLVLFLYGKTALTLLALLFIAAANLIKARK